MPSPPWSDAIDPAMVDELRFHLRELRRDLPSLAHRVRDLLSVPTDDAVDAVRRRQELTFVAAAVEHDAEDHAAPALEIARTLRIGQRAAVTASPRPENEGESAAGQDGELTAAAVRAELTAALRQALDGLEAASVTVDQMAEPLDPAPDVIAAIESGLSGLVQLLGERCSPPIGHALDLAGDLYRLLDPVAAAAEDRLDELATSLREIAHPDAHVLAHCPFCGAPLGPDDRTFDGSFCEVCRTHWYEPGDPPTASRSPS